MDCEICGQLAGRPHDDLLYRLFGGRYQRRVADLNSSFGLIPSIGALVPGHLLLVPEVHVRAFAQLGHEHRSAVDSWLERLAWRLGRIAGAPVQMFEHGDAAHSEKASCTVAHAHLHLAPIAVDLWARARDVCGGWTSVTDLATLPAVVGDGEYLAIREVGGNWRIAQPTDVAAGHPSQLLRRVLASAAGCPTEWDWRRHPHLERTATSWTIAQDVMLAESGSLDVDGGDLGNHGMNAGVRFDPDSRAA